MARIGFVETAGTNLMVRSLAFGNETFVALFASAGFATSDDGAIWTQQSFDPTLDIIDLKYLQGSFIAAGGQLHSPGRAMILRSSDGRHWTPTMLDTTTTLRGVAFENGRYLATGLIATSATQGVVYTSVDGVNCSRPSSPVPSVVGLASGNGVFVGTLGGGGLASSTNGVDWAFIDFPLNTGRFASVSFAEGNFLAVGSPGLIQTSSDGTANFSVHDSPMNFFTVTNARQNASYTVVVSNIVNSPGELSGIAQLVVVADTDGDGSPDAYETERGFDPANSNDGALDADGDGVSNAVEYLAGTDPQQAESHLKVERLLADSGGARLEFMAAAGKTYTVQFTDDVSSGPWSRLTDLPALPSASLRSITDRPSVATRFYRLVTPQQP